MQQLHSIILTVYTFSWWYLQKFKTSSLGIVLQIDRLRLSVDQDLRGAIGFGGTVVRATTFHLWDRGSNSRNRLMWKESVNALPIESRGFSPGAPVSSHGESRQGGLG
jgi:hypothetical protein